jgi:hypothetical protein
MPPLAVRTFASPLAPCRRTADTVTVGPSWGMFELLQQVGKTWIHEPLAGECSWPPGRVEP